MSDTTNTPALPPPASPPRAARARASGFIGGIVGGVAVVAIVMAGGAALWPSLRAKLVPHDDANVAVVADLNKRVAALEAAAGKPVASESSVTTLTGRVDALEHAASQPPPAQTPDLRVAELTTKTADLASQVAALHAATGDLTELRAQVDRAESAAKDARDAAARRQSAEATLLAVGQLRDAIERGGSYAAELASARKVAPSDAGAALDALAVSADTGVARRANLAQEFPPVAAAIVRAAELPPDTGDFWGRLEHEAASLVSLRRVDGQGSDASSVAARAEKDMKVGDLNGAVHELSALDGAPATAAKDWLAAANARLTTEAALSDLIAKSAAATAPGSG